MGVTLAQAFRSLHISVHNFFPSAVCHLSAEPKDSQNQASLTCWPVLWDPLSESSFWQLFIGQHLGELIAGRTPGKVTKQLLLMLWGKISLMCCCQTFWTSIAALGLGEELLCQNSWWMSPSLIKLGVILLSSWCVFKTLFWNRRDFISLPFQGVFLWALIQHTGSPILYQSDSDSWMALLPDIAVLSGAKLS